MFEKIDLKSLGPDVQKAWTYYVAAIQRTQAAEQLAQNARNREDDAWQRLQKIATRAAAQPTDK